MLMQMDTVNPLCFCTHLQTNTHICTNTYKKILKKVCKVNNSPFIYIKDKYEENLPKNILL